MVSYDEYNEINDHEKSLIKQLVNFPDVIAEAGNLYDPSSVANYSYSLAKEFHRFYHDVRILNSETEAARSFRIDLSTKVGEVLLSSFDLLGIEMPDRM